MASGNTTTSSATNLDPTSFVAVPMKLFLSIADRLDLRTSTNRVVPVSVTVLVLPSSVRNVTLSPWTAVTSPRKWGAGAAAMATAGSTANPAASTAM